MKIFAIIIATLSIFFSTSCVGRNNNFGLGEVRHFYENKDLYSAEQIILSASNGYSNSIFFPYSANILVLRALKSQSQEDYQRALALIRKLKGKSLDQKYSAYEKFIIYLMRNGEAMRFAASSDARCANELAFLERMDSYDYQFGFGRAAEDATYWYALYVNNMCTTSKARAILIRNLSETDLTRGKEMLAQVAVGEKSRGSSADVLYKELCDIRQWQYYYGTDKRSKLEEAGVLKCSESIDELAKRSENN